MLFNDQDSPGLEFKLKVINLIFSLVAMKQEHFPRMWKLVSRIMTQDTGVWHDALLALRVFCSSNSCSWSKFILLKKNISCSIFPCITGSTSRLSMFKLRVMHNDNWEEILYVTSGTFNVKPLIFLKMYSVSVHSSYQPQPRSCSQINMMMFQVQSIVNISTLLSVTVTRSQVSWTWKNSFRYSITKQQWSLNTKMR